MENIVIVDIYKTVNKDGLATMMQAVLYQTK